MADCRLRKQIALEAAKMMYTRMETEYYTAKRKAARGLRLGSRLRPSDLPSNREIRDQILGLAVLHEGEARTRRLCDMRLYALWLMRQLARFRPRLIGSVCSGHVRKGSDIDIHVFSDTLAAVTLALDQVALRYETERKRVLKHNEERTFTHVHVHGRYEAELTVYAETLVSYVFKSSITGKGMESATIQELAQIMAREHPGVDVEDGVAAQEAESERFEMFKLLLLPLEDVGGGPHHPEGDALYHSLQAFDLAREVRAWDVDFVLAALLHDVGKAIDPADHAAAGAEAVSGLVSDRVLFLVRHHMDALALGKGELGRRAARRLRESPHFDDLMELRDLDSDARHAGRIVDSLEEALDYLKDLDADETPR